MGFVGGKISWPQTRKFVRQAVQWGNNSSPSEVNLDSVEGVDGRPGEKKTLWLPRHEGVEGECVSKILIERNNSAIDVFSSFVRRRQSICIARWQPAVAHFVENKSIKNQYSFHGGDRVRDV